MRVSEYMQYKKVLIKKKHAIVIFILYSKSQEIKKKLNVIRLHAEIFYLFLFLMFIQLCNLYATEFL